MEQSIKVGNYSITKQQNDSIEVTKDGVLCSNTKAALREIAEQLGFEADEKWTTRQLGAKLIKFVEDKSPSISVPEEISSKPVAKEEPKVEATAAELASARVKVYGKAQNRTALGIVHAYMVMYPHATLEDLRKAFPNSLNPASGVKENFILSTEKGTEFNWEGFFKKEEELLTMGDGKKVAFVTMWTKPCFEALVAHAKQYGILVADFEKADGGAKKGGFRLEYLNGYVPPVPGKSKKGMWIAIAVVALLLLGLLALFLGRRHEPRVVEKVVTVVDTVYIQQLEEIEKNFNAAEFIAGKAELSDDAKFVLHDLAKMMRKHPKIRLQLVGHTSSEGDAAFNLKLSEDRAKAAVDFMISHGGIDASRLEAVGKGSSESKNPENPMAPENRRTEFIVLE